MRVNSGEYLIDEIKLFTCDAIYIGNTQQTFRKRMYGNFHDILHLLKNWKYDSFADHFEQHFKYTTSRTNLRKCMAFKVVKHINPIGTMQIFTKPNCNLCTEERLTILKKLHEICVTLMNNNFYIYKACRHKMTFRQSFLSTYDPV